MRKPPPGPHHWRHRFKRGCHLGLALLDRLPGGLRTFAALNHRLRGGHAAYRLAMSLADAGRLPLALRFAEASLPSALHAYSPTPPPFPVPHTSVAPPPDHEAMLTTCLDAALQALASLPHARPFLAYGTLLGMVREGGFLPADPDIDLGVFHPDFTPGQVESALLLAGFHLTRRADPAWPGVTQAIHPQGGGLDVVYFKRHESSLLTHSVLFGRRVARRRPAFDLAPASFLGRTVWIPSPPALFLTPNYGDWHTRPAYYHNLLSPDLTLDDPANPALALLARAELIRLLHLGHPAPLTLFLDLVQRRFSHDPLWAQIAPSLAARQP